MQHAHPFLCFIQKYIVRDVRYKTLLIQQANIQAHHKVLDLGCGTGTFENRNRRRLLDVLW